MKDLSRLLASAARASALGLVVALPLFAGFMFTDRVLSAAGIALLVLLFAALSCALGARIITRGVGAAAWPLWGFVAWLVVATVTSVYLHASLVDLVQMTACVGLLVLFASLFSNERWRRAGWIAIVAAGAIEAVIGLRDWTQTVIFQGDPSWRIFGTMYNPNVLAGYLLVVIPATVVVLALARQWDDRGGEDRPRIGSILAGFALVVACAALLLTASRAGLLGAIFAVAVLVGGLPTRIRASWIVAAVAAMIVLVIVAPPLRERVLSATAESHSAVFRWYTWVGTADMIAARPITGFGPGSFEHAYPQFAQVGFTRMAHQTPLQIAADAGLPALALVLAAVLMIARALVRGLREGGTVTVESAAALAALTGVGVQNLADYSWHVPAVGLTLSAAVGLALAATREGSEPIRPRRWLCAAAGGLALVAMIGCAIGLRAQVLASRGEAEIERGRYQIAAGWLRQAAEVDPLNAAIRHRLAQATAAAGPGGMQRAVQERLELARINPLDAGNYLALAELYRELGEEASAASAAKRAIEVHPIYLRAYVVLALLLEEMGREDEAMATWRAMDALYQSPVGRYQALAEVADYSWAYAWLALGREADERGDIAAAEDYYRRAAALTDEFARVQRAREEILKQIGTWDEARVREAERIRDSAERALRRIESGDER